MYVTNGPGLECSALILFSPFWLELRSDVWLGCDERFTWLSVLRKHQLFQITVFLLDLAEILVSSVSSLSGQQRWNLVNMRDHRNGPERIFFGLFLFLCVSQ